MNWVRLELLRVARLLLGQKRSAFIMTERQWKVYKKEHPNADPKNHKIIKPKKQLRPHEMHHVKMSKKDIKGALTHGHWTIVSAGRNPSNSEEAKMSDDDPFFDNRARQLQADLETMGMPYTVAVGHYGGSERSFMVFHDDNESEASKKAQKAYMVHHRKDSHKDARTKIDELGAKYNQDSVLHGESGTNRIHFTSGKNKGEDCGGKGWDELPDAKDYFTELGEGREHTKFSLNVDECFEKGFFD